MPEKLSLAVIAVGRMGRLHAQNAAKHPDVDLVAIVDTNRDVAQKTSEELDIPYHYASIEELIKSGKAQAFIVSSPTDLHISQTIALLDAGQGHCVMLEKPLSDSLESSQELMDYLGDSNDRLMHAMVRRFDPAYLYVKQMIDDETIGKVFKIDSVLEDSAYPPPGYVSPGILIDMAIHNVDEVCWLIGQEPKKVASTGSKLYARNMSEIEEEFDDARLEIEFDDGSLGKINVSRNHVSGYRVETTVFGTEGRICLGHFDGDSSLVKVVTIGRGEQILGTKQFYLKKPEEGVPEFIFRFLDAYENELDYFVQQCLSRQGFNVTQKDGYRAMQIVFAGKQALQHQDAGYITI